MIFSFIRFWYRVKTQGFSDKLIDDPFITKLVFYPRKESFSRTREVEHLKFVMEDGTTLSGFYIEKYPSGPTKLLFHGNGEIINDYLDFSHIYTGTGYNLAAIDFRGYGESDGKPCFSSLLIDALPVCMQFREYLGDRKSNTDIVVLGRSLGSVCASVIGAENPDGLKAVVFDSGFANLHKLWMSGVRVPGIRITDEQLAPWSNDRYISKIKVPVQIIHGTRDEVIPISQAELIKKSVSDVCTYNRIQGAGHNDTILYQEYRSILSQFLAQITA